jgi:hypothetical protein
MESDRGNEKPVVFFSHSSKDAELVKLIKDRLNEAYNGAIDFFVSSDGQSIPWGSNWVDEIHKNLNNAKLLFIILTPNSYQAPWLYYESGFALGHDSVDTIPVSIGVQLDSISGPLGFRQGFNVSDEQGLNNIVSILNDHLALTCRTDLFKSADFSQIMHLLNADNNLSEMDYFYTIQANEGLVIRHSEIPDEAEKNTTREEISLYQQSSQKLIDHLRKEGSSLNEVRPANGLGSQHYRTIRDGVSIDIDSIGENYSPAMVYESLGVNITASPYALDKALEIYHLCANIFGSISPLSLNLKPYMTIPDTDEDISALLSHLSKISVSSEQDMIFSFENLLFQLTNHGARFRRRSGMNPYLNCDAILVHPENGTNLSSSQIQELIQLLLQSRVVTGRLPLSQKEMKAVEAEKDRKKQQTSLDLSRML